MLVLVQGEGSVSFVSVGELVGEGYVSTLSVPWSCWVETVLPEGWVLRGMLSCWVLFLVRLCLG